MPPTIYPPRRCEPAGAYDGIVVDARVVSLEFRQSATNPDGMVLRCGVELIDDLGTATVYDAASLDNPRRLKELASAAGVDFDGDVDRLAHRLMGCQVRAVVRNITPAQGRNAGKPKAVISSWISTATHRETHYARRD
jgi:hypothetical protein